MIGQEFKPSIVAKSELQSTTTPYLPNVNLVRQGHPPPGWPPWNEKGYKKRIRASSFQQGTVCPASVYLGQALERAKVNISSDYATIGTQGHRWLELRIREGLKSANQYFEENNANDALRLAVNEIWLHLLENQPSPYFADPANCKHTLITEGRMPPFALTDGTTITGTRDFTELSIPLRRAWLYDWKFYNQMDWLPTMSEDLQMYSYAVGTWKEFPWIEHITVYRVGCYFCKIEKLEMDYPALELAEEALSEEAERIWKERERFQTGSQCTRCFKRTFCKTFLDMHNHIGTRQLKPYNGGEFSSEAEVMRFLIAKPSLEQLISEGEKAAKSFVESIGRNLVDINSGEDWGPRPSKMDVIRDQKGCLAELINQVGKEKAISKVTLTKGAMETAMKELKIKPKERAEFLQRLRELQYMVKEEKDPQWRWKKVK